MQHQRRQGEVVDLVHPLGDLDLLLIVGMDLDQHAQAALVAPSGDLVDEAEGFRRHEGRQAGRLDRVPDGVQPDLGHPGRGELVQHLPQVVPGELIPDVDVDLLRGEGGPHQALAAVGEAVGREGQPRPGPVKTDEILFAGSLGKGGPEGQEHPVVG